MQRKTDLKRYRVACLVISMVALLCACAAKFYQGPYWRIADAYFGDIFIVICLYFWLALLRPSVRIITKFLMIACLSTAVELLQATGLPASLNLSEPFVFILGTSFDPIDFVCYGVGLLCAVFIDNILNPIHHGAFGAAFSHSQKHPNHESTETTEV